MKALVFSDSHGVKYKMENAIMEHGDIDLIFFLGDGLRDIDNIKEEFPQKKIVAVKGNCDFGQAGNDVAYKYIEGNTVVITHGHNFDVKLTLKYLEEHTLSVLGNVALYGHTHRAEFHYSPASCVYFLNPGSISAGSYAVVSFEKGEVTASLLNI